MQKGDRQKIETSKEERDWEKKRQKKKRKKGVEVKRRNELKKNPQKTRSSERVPTIQKNDHLAAAAP